jgi:nucleotide-binding universal stress UspA family protein
MSAPKITKILCATDFTPFARRALRIALTLARRHAAEIRVLHVYQTTIPFAAGDVPYYPVTVPFSPAARKAANDELGEFVAAAADAGVPATMEMVEGDPCATILERALSGGADLIALGTHGRRGFDRWLMGSVAERILAKAHCPVLTVAAEPETPSGWPRPRTPATTRRVLCALDLSEHSARTLAYASFLAAAARARLSALYVAEELYPWSAPGEALSTVPFEGDFLEAREKRAAAELHALVPASAEGLGEIERIVVTGTPHREILRVAREHGADFIVMGVHGRPALGVSLLGSTARHVVREASCPVITVRPRP